MPRNYKRTTDRQSWSTDSMEKAIRAIRDSKMGWLLASKTFGVPQPTLRRHVLGTNKTLESNSKGLGGWKCSHWAHASCADVPKRTKRFICELCQ